MNDKATKMFWILIHDFFAHPVCAWLWVLGFSKAGDWLHEASLHPLNYQEEKWSENNASEEEVRRG